MSTTDLTADSFATTVADHAMVLVDFWATWCGPCHMFSPVYEAASERHTDILFGKVETDAEPGIAAAAGIGSIPTLTAFKDGILVLQQSGALPTSLLEQFIADLRAMDMEHVHSHVAAHGADGGASAAQ